MSASSRRWLEFRVRSPAAGELQPLLAEALLALGGRAVEETDGWLCTHLEEPADPEAHLEGARALFVEFVGPAPVEIRTRWIDHEDWAETWKRGLAPRRISERLLVTTTWDPVEPESGVSVIVIDPGMAFGTAEHGTTRGCLRLLDGTVTPSERLLDVGAGSGILAIAAAHLGAADVVCIEGDPLAVEALAENVVANGVADRVRWQTRWADGDLLAALHPRDGVVANIESGILRPLLPGFAAVLDAGGWLVVSGILDIEWDALRRDTEAAGFAFEAVDADGEWRSGKFIRS